MRLAIETLPNRVFSLLVVLAALLVSAFTLPARAAIGNLLADRSPARAEGVSNVKVLTDGQRALEGEDWTTTAAAILSTDRAFVEYDLGQSVPIVAAYLQGDNNDEYIVTVSEDGKTFSPLWTASPRSEPGLRERWSDTLSGKGRYVRLGVRGGDRAYSVTELQVFSEKPAASPNLPRVAGESQASRVRTMLLYFAGAFGVFLFFTSAASSTGRLLLMGLVPVVAGGLALQELDAGWPLASREVAFVRGVAAAIALLAVLRRVFPGKRQPAHSTVIAVALGTSAIMAFAAFYNLGRPQFWDHKRAQPEFVHTYDMRVYQPFARYFKELQYDGVYLASVLAYAEDQRGGSLESIARTELRGLTDHKVRRVADVGKEIQEVRRRFTDARWADLRRDMLFFEEVMGNEFLSSMTDHGANATPVWVFFARFFLAPFPATEGSLTIAGLADAVLLAGLAVAMWRSFGLLPMLLAMTVFGANDLYMFGTNWTGATLRHDWLVLLGFGACALKKEHYKLAGVCLGLSAMIRAFPGAALIGVCIPALWTVYDRVRKDGKLPSPKSIIEDNPETVRVIGSALVCMVSAFLITGALYGFGSWLNWWHKVTLLNRDVGVNEISLRALVAGADGTAGRVFQARRLLWAAAMVVCVSWIALLGRRRPLHQSMLISLPLVLIIFNPSNYYSHFIFLPSLLASTVGTRKNALLDPKAEPPRVVPLVVPFHWVAGPLLALCVGGYWSSLEPDLERHFQNETVLLFLALGWLYANLTRKDQTLKSALLG
jgi:hypothetical protein